MAIQTIWRDRRGTVGSSIAQVNAVAGIKVLMVECVHEAI